MKKTTLLLLQFLYILTAGAQTTPEKIDALVSAYTRFAGFSGSVLVAQKGSVLLDKGYGYRDFATHSFNDSNTIYQIGSITKQFTSAIILQLTEKKKLSVQDKLSKYIPDYPKGDSITIEHLLTHTSGIFNYTEEEDFVQKHATLPVSRDSLIAAFKNKPLQFSPGTQFRYSNSNYVLLGYIIEKVTGKSWFEVVSKNIFQPLQMTHSGFDFKALNSPDKAIGYATKVPGFKVPIIDSSVSFAAGAIYTTTGDLYKWDRSLYTNRILQPASLQKAFTPHLEHYGYGWIIDTVYGKRVIRHNGAVTGFVSLILRIPEEDICIIVLENQFSQASPSSVGEGINAILHNKEYPIPHERVAIHVDTAILQQYTGAYQLAPQLIMTITLADGQLYEQLTGQQQFPIFPEKENYFFLKVVDAQIEFVTNNSPRPEKLILHQNGRDMPAPRVNQ